VAGERFVDNANRAGDWAFFSQFHGAVIKPEVAPSEEANAHGFKKAGQNVEAKWRSCATWPLVLIVTVQRLPVMSAQPAMLAPPDRRRRTQRPVVRYSQ
jgi:hypothetical protein